TPVCKSRGEGGSRKMLEPGMCPAETSLTPFVTRSLILLCFSVTHRGRGQRHSSPLLPAAACCISLRPLLALQISWYSTECLIDGQGPLIHLHSQNVRLSFGVDEIRWNR
uniref:Uncharacterized protein n=1 Tax=Colobus angolensis palliatus TaxID=336983 RepID=A0A2K5JM25_COLAP